jgi:hypothetical protein
MTNGAEAPLNAVCNVCVPIRLFHKPSKARKRPTVTVESAQPERQGSHARAAKPQMRRFAGVHWLRPPSRFAQRIERRGKRRSRSGGCA